MVWLQTGPLPSSLSIDQTISSLPSGANQAPLFTKPAAWSLSFFFIGEENRRHNNGRNNNHGKPLVCVCVTVSIVQSRWQPATSGGQKGSHRQGEQAATKSATIAPADKRRPAGLVIVAQW